MSFGFSVGDLIGAAGLVYRLIKALHGSQDAGEGYRAAISELGTYQQALMQTLRDKLRAQISNLNLLLAAAHLETQDDAANATEFLDTTEDDREKSSEELPSGPRIQNNASLQIPENRLHETLKRLNGPSTPTEIEATTDSGQEELIPQTAILSVDETQSHIDFVSREASSTFLLSAYPPEALRSIILDPLTRGNCVSELSNLLMNLLSMGEGRLSLAQYRDLLSALEILCKEPAQLTDNPRPAIKFKDAVGRKFSFPWHLCKTWKGMEELIKQAFLHIDEIGPHVHAGHYDLVGPNGEIILPQVWETMVQPDWAITMHMWPIPDPEPPPPPPLPVYDLANSPTK